MSDTTELVLEIGGKIIDTDLYCMRSFSREKTDEIKAKPIGHLGLETVRGLFASTYNKQNVCATIRQCECGLRMC